MKILKVALMSLAFAAVLVSPSLVSADVNDFTVTSFKADETLTRNDRQGMLHVVERINVNFQDYNHGILRAIPKSYKHHSLQLKVNGVSSESGAPAEYSTYNSNGNTVLKIGDPDRTVTGQQEYTLDYTLRNVVTFYKDHDELYWDVNGDQWQQPFEQVSVQLHLPSGVRQHQAPLCYAGSFGSSGQACTVNVHDNLIQAETAQPLSANQTLTYVAVFDKGYFQPSKWYETSGEFMAMILKVALLPVLVFVFCLIRWLRSGRDKGGRQVIVPQYEAPDGLKPIEVGGLLDFKADNRDVTATIVDLAVRKYIRIIEQKEKKKLHKDALTYQLELLKVDFAELESFEARLLRNIFTQQSPGEIITLNKAKSSLYDTAKVIKSEVAKRLTDNGYFRQDPTKAGTVYYVAAGFLFFVVWIAGAVVGFEVIIGVVLSVIILLVFGFLMPARTVKGVETLERVKGLKMYLEIAEKDRIQKLQSPDAPYAAAAGEPVKTVELFEKLLPYAMVLGVEKQWAGQFESLYNTPPDWYSGNWTTFNAVYLASSLNEGIGAAVNMSFASPSSSSGSGFGGGGFSGGGGGGGGGGGW